MSLGDRIKEARLRVGLTQQQLGEIIGVRKQTITGYEKGEREPDAIKLNKIAQVLNVTGDYLLDLANEGIGEKTNAQHSLEALRFAKDFDDLTDEGKRLARGFMAVVLQEYRKP